MIKANKDNIHLFQKKLCSMLDDIIDIFDKYDLTWFADSGTLLGAVRENKMIDWDNDIDIVMPIKDYVKFLEIAKTELPNDLRLNNPEANIFSHRLHTTIVDYNTSFINIHDYSSDDLRVEMMIKDKLDTCMLIDIYGLEHVPEKHSKFFKQYLSWTNFNQDYLCHRWKHPELMPVIDNNYSKLLHNFYLSTLLKIDEAFSNSEYVICHNCMPVTIYEDLQLKANWYSEYKLADFKYLKHKLRLPIGYEHILFLTYGDDYKIPKQVDHVGCSAYDFIFDVDKRTDFTSASDFKNYLSKFYKETK